MLARKSGPRKGLRASRHFDGPERSPGPEQAISLPTIVIGKRSDGEEGPYDPGPIKSTRLAARGPPPAPDDQPASDA